VEWIHSLYWSFVITFSTQALTETVQNNIFALLLFGFGILVSLFPFHSWAPKGYAVAPTGAAMLHAGVLKKFGLYGLLQIAAHPCSLLVPNIGSLGSFGWRWVTSF
jgi:NADH:ubiquinone oxidoreductase subunit 4 (subunit M)